MLRELKYIIAALLTLSMSASSLGRESSASTHRNATPSKAQESASKPANTAKNTPPKPKYLIRIHSLRSFTLTFGADSCFPGTLDFPATNAADVAKILGSDSGFTFSAIPPDKIVAYHESATPSPAALQRLKQLEDHMDELASADFSRATSIRVANGYADKSIAQLTVPPDGSIVVRNVGSNCVVVVSKQQSDPVALASLTRAISESYAQHPVTPPTQRLFYIDASTVAKKLSGSNDSSGTTNDGGTDKSPSPPPKTPSKTNSGPFKGDNSSASAGSGNRASGDTSAAPKTKPPDSGDDSDDSADQSNPPDSPTAGAPSKDADNKPSISDGTKGQQTTEVSAKPPSMQAVNDTLVFSNEDGSDRGIFERNRLMAALDLPRPEVLMNIWSLQASSKKPEVIAAEADAARGLIAEHNDLLQHAIDNGWNSLSHRMRDPSQFFDPLFYWYITQKFGVTAFQVDPAPVQTVATHSSPSAVIKFSSQPQSTVEKAIEGRRKSWGWCNSDQYCLGFSHAFEPLRPTLTNLIIGIAAAKAPFTTAQALINDMEGQPAPPRLKPPCKPPSVLPSDANHPCEDPASLKTFRACIAKVDQKLHTFQAQSYSCDLEDRITQNEQILAGQEESLRLNCFRQQAKESFGPERPEQSYKLDAQSEDRPAYAATRVGLLRASIADFLFNYKWAAQYPHSFIPYDLAQSAQELNAEFNPLVLAFNRDVSAFTENLQDELHCKYDANINKQESWLSGGDHTFINDGILSVRGISGVKSLVDTVTQSFFDATTPPSLTDLVKSVSDAEKNTPGVLKANLTTHEASVLLGALNSVQPATAKIGRELKLDITPHSLAGASSAELEVSLTAEESANPTRFTAEKSTEDTLSRISKHDVSTRVRVESLKLFEVSAFSAMLQRPRSKFPIIPPFFEVPYFGSFLGWPLKGAQVFHRSTAVVSAVIVPTAADLAFGIDFGADRICDEEGCHRAKSPDDFGTLPLRNFHRAVIECLASGESTPYTGLRQNVELIRSQPDCEHLTLYGVPPKE